MFARGFDRLARGADGMADAQPGIPKGIEHLSHPVGGHRPVVQQHEIDVGEEAHLPSAVSSGGDDRDPLAGGFAELRQHPVEFVGQ